MVIFSRDDNGRGFVQGDVRDGATILRNAGGLWLSQVVQDVHPGPVLRHQPFRGCVCCSDSLLPLHLHEQPLRDGRQIHRRRHAIQARRASISLPLGRFLRRRLLGLAHHFLLPRYLAQHACYGHSAAPSHVRRFHAIAHGATRGSSVHHMVKKKKTIGFYFNRHRYKLDFVQCLFFTQKLKLCALPKAINTPCHTPKSVESF